MSLPALGAAPGAGRSSAPRPPCRCAGAGLPARRARLPIQGQAPPARAGPACPRPTAGCRSPTAGCRSCPARRCTAPPAGGGAPPGRRSLLASPGASRARGSARQAAVSRQVPPRRSAPPRLAGARSPAPIPSWSSPGQRGPASYVGGVPRRSISCSSRHGNGLDDGPVLGGEVSGGDVTMAEDEAVRDVISSVIDDF